MTYNKLEDFVSKPRLDRYLLTCKNSRSRAKDLYAANLKVAQAFYPVLNLFEIFLRNSINSRLQNHFNDPSWILNQKTGFMSHHSLRTDFWIRKQVLKAERKIRGTPTPGKIISEQSFGFWTSLFEKKHYGLIGGSSIHCFPNKPSPVNRHAIAASLKDIREFRNRIYHNEAICFRNLAVDFAHAIRIKTEIYNLLEWMDEDLPNYVAQFDDIDANISRALSI
jgi:hypothetical protein